MNIFYLDHDHTTCAKYHNDKHCVKMILEYAQLLCTAHRELDGDNCMHPDVLYKATHKNHPSAVWTRQCSRNYIWLYYLWRELCKEYTYRYGKEHASWTKLGLPYGTSTTEYRYNARVYSTNTSDARRMQNWANITRKLQALL